MNENYFDELVSKCVLSGVPHRLLYVFIHATFMDENDLGENNDGEEAGIVQILFDAHQPAQHGLTFDSIRQTADAQNPDWNIVVIGIAQNSDSTLPTDEQARSFLEDMREKILVGDIEYFSLLDREGNHLEIDTSVGEDDDDAKGAPSPTSVH